ncbi:GRIM-19 protein [Prunus dulcis]|uniref:NADH dehydrogenase [ubiquinone] 1 alpha subcomplex subunit 13 n=1 Tax=Prunus dulcis TaxID=3755 RepID=A0A4Y1QLE8_PRUDU|nr:GRIM-19 protein [Prunus dulcis]
MTEAVIRNKPGMASVKDMPVLQDGPPPGGFAPVRYARRIPNKGPSAVAIFLAAFGTFSWGMYEVGKGNKIRRAIKAEKYAARRAILPVLQAEEDERFVKEWKKYLDYEAEVMKDVPNWKVVRVSTTLGDGCPQQLASCALKFGDTFNCSYVCSSLYLVCSLMHVCLWCNVIAVLL